jgi:hypothetical protein
LVVKTNVLLGLCRGPRDGDSPVELVHTERRWPRGCGPLGRSGALTAGGCVAGLSLVALRQRRGADAQAREEGVRCGAAALRPGAGG